MPERRPRADRAQQFMPFAALKGYYDLIRERERTVEPRRELTDEQALELSRKLSHVERRKMASVVHYDGEAYVTTRGLVTDIDLAGRTITVVRTRIAFDDIADIEVEPLSPESRGSRP
ncbi:hypothetical protein [Gordonibacter massiliensis (ex Traore et al. 2017)]|uniref:YolD-like family protein n=1 Tax=Gordonibacter massiliensis (ex Traore et al. 2017) TaxID=1841863 RepID=A0A842JH30_9ACTN|nr:hypothetical protein [Gordonibacter massiliensis (ex Traore et al. 2017)]MBC2889791.1 hypothetical protein [Gordonibacter massiliensis (ex Traore et al. 2017)]